MIVMKEMLEKINKIITIYDEDEKRYGGYVATQRLHDSAPEDYIESRTDWSTLKSHADDMYYMLSSIRQEIEELKEDIELEMI